MKGKLIKMDMKVMDSPEHEHTLKCGHKKFLHLDHVDYLEKNGHLHHKHEDHWDECSFAVTDSNQNGENNITAEMHDKNCGHDQVVHGDHKDFLVNGRLHHVHSDHVDDHGAVNELI